MEMSAYDEMDASADSAAIVLMVQQGIHTLLMLEMGANSVKTPPYEAEFVKIFEFTMWNLFRYAKRDATEDRAQRILSTSLDLVKQAQREHASILQDSYDAWGDLLIGLSDQSLRRMGEVLQASSDWCRQHMPTGSVYGVEPRNRYSSLNRAD